MLSVLGHGFTMIDHVDQATSSWTDFQGDRKPNLRGRRAPETPGLFTCAAHHFLDRPAPHALWPAKAQKKVGEPTISRQQMGFSYGFHGDIRIYIIWIYWICLKMGYTPQFWQFQWRKGWQSMDLGTLGGLLPACWRRRQARPTGTRTPAIAGALSKKNATLLWSRSKFLGASII